MLPTLLHDHGISLTVSQQGINTRGYNNPGLVGSPRPQRGGVQSLNRTITPVGTTLPSADEIQENTPMSVKHSSYEELE
jgi:hypothetical protein